MEREEEEEAEEEEERARAGERARERVPKQWNYKHACRMCDSRIN
jgi:hypothetical protein